MAGNLWRKKLVLHGARVDDLVGYSVNAMAPTPGKGAGFATAGFVRRHTRWPEKLAGGVVYEFDQTQTQWNEDWKKGNRLQWREFVRKPGKL